MICLQKEKRTWPQTLLCGLFSVLSDAKASVTRHDTNKIQISLIVNWKTDEYERPLEEEKTRSDASSLQSTRSE